LALPGLSVAVEGVHKCLKSAISWARGERGDLESLGQNVANIVSGVVNALAGLQGHWRIIGKMIKLVGQP